MQSDLYQIETEKLAVRNGNLLDELATRLDSHEVLSPLEEQAMLHLLQVIIENAIGKARHLLKRRNIKPPVSAYDVFEEMLISKLIDIEQQNQWKKIVGLRNTLVHEYMKIQIDIVKDMVKNRHYSFVLDFLLKPFDQF